MRPRCYIRRTKKRGEMFGKIWPVGQWAGLGAVIGGLFQLVQAMNQGLFTHGFAYVSGRLLGGAVVGAIFGVFVALIRNHVAGGK